MIALAFEKEKVMTKPTVAAGFAKALLGLAVSKGASPQQLFKQSGINEEDLLDLEHHIPLENYLALMEAGKELCNEPALALQFGEMVSMPEMSIVYLICRSAETVAKAYVQMNRYARLVIDTGEATDLCVINRNEDGAWIELTSAIYIKYPQLTQSGLARAVTGAASLFGGRQLAKAVHVTHEEPAYRAEYDRIFKVPVFFGSDKNALLIDESFLSFKLSPSSNYVFGILSEHADALLQRLESSKTIKGKVESLLLPILHTGDLGMPLIAKKMGISRQVLYRRLKAEGISYEKLLDELRHQLALDYLNAKKVSVKEAAYLVGFSDPGSFSRAFKRWTGSSPKLQSIV